MHTRLDGAPQSFKSAPVNARGYPDVRFSLQFYVEDCTGCALCASRLARRHSPVEPGVKAINLDRRPPWSRAERANIAFFERLPVNDRARVDFANVRGVQFLEPLFEFSGACAGCGETPYLKLLSQLFGDRLHGRQCHRMFFDLWRQPARDALEPELTKGAVPPGRTPCSRTMPNSDSDSGLAADKHLTIAQSLLKSLSSELGEDVVTAILTAPQIRESEIRAQRIRVAELKTKLLALTTHNELARDLLSVVAHLVRRSIWIVGGDGWAYDIGYGGLDHVLASGRDVNVLVLDTEVYSNTGGQASKATPLGAIAKFAAAGKRVPRKDLALQAIAYGNVYVAQSRHGREPTTDFAGLPRSRGL